MLNHTTEEHSDGSDIPMESHARNRKHRKTESFLHLLLAAIISDVNFFFFDSLTHTFPLF